MRVRIMSLGIAGVAAAGLLAGCGGEEEPAAAPPAEVAPSSPAAPEQSAPAAGAGAAEATKPGTELKIGERAVVPVKVGSSSGTVAITVTAIEPGDRASFEQKFGAKAQQMDPYHIRYTVENVGGTDLSRTTTPLLKAVGPGGGSTGAVLITTGSTPGCDRARPDDAFSRAGATLETCRLQAARKGTPVAGAEYDDDEGGYEDSPIIWSK